MIWEADHLVLPETVKYYYSDYGTFDSPLVNHRITIAIMKTATVRQEGRPDIKVAAIMNMGTGELSVNERPHTWEPSWVDWKGCTEKHFEALFQIGEMTYLHQMRDHRPQVFAELIPSHF